MYKLFFPLIALFAAQAVAQESERNQRISMLNDSVRQVEQIGKKDRVLRRHYYVGERPVGIWQEFDDKGKLLAERDFGKLRYDSTPVRTDSIAKASEDNTGSEMPPQFPGGEAELFKFLGRTTRYPMEALEEGIMGVVFIQGTVDETGRWRTTAIRRGAHPYLDYEAWRVADLMPVWTPATKDGKPVAAEFVLPIKFTLR